MSGAPQTSAAGKPRVAWVDIAKGVAIILVILGHTFTSGGLANKLIFSFHMPLFFILAGYTFKVKPWKTIIGASAKRLLVPFVVVFLLNSALTYTWWIGNPGQLLPQFVFALAWQPAPLPPVDFPGIGAIWFLVCMFWARLVLNGCLMAFERSRFSVAAQAVVMVLVGYAGVALGRHVLLPFDVDIALTASLFMFAGYLMRTRDLQKYLFKWPVILGCIVVWAVSVNFSYLEMGTRNYQHFFVALVCALCASVVALRFAKLVEDKADALKLPGRALKRYLVFMGKNSMFVFCIHHLETSLIAWRALPYISSLPASAAFACAARVVFDSVVSCIKIPYDKLKTRSKQ